ncbi:unnamed protein product [Didymodactylos carnosus]|uniref:Amino acid transporter transmembrane domain-containing protein n=1 Tax=Didymodactylos carnosus TaxID=1234261 RepID=A0A814BYB8_9BILA|nr:unnamed protein product [Didymodactylos carnosus]CAF3710683.1 unnamed protein product [Didymodactylos carnosus]
MDALRTTKQVLIHHLQQKFPLSKPTQITSYQKFDTKSISSETLLLSATITNHGTINNKNTTESFTSSSYEPIHEFNDKTKKNGLTALEAAWNVTNAIQGMFLVSLPYTVYHGGYWALLSMIVVAWICTYTGEILIACLYETNTSGTIIKVRHSYVAIAEHVWGKRFGGRLVFIAQNIELLMTCILYLVLMGELLAGSFPQLNIPVRVWICLSCLFTIPYSFIKNLRIISRFSFGNAIVHLIINMIIILYCLSKSSTWNWSKIQLKINIQSFPTTVGIIVFSYTSQIFLPTLEDNMLYPSQFNSMLILSHIIACIFKTGFALIGFLTWQELTSEVITNNLPTKQLRILINLTLAIKALLSYPLPYFASCELISDTYFRNNPFSTCYQQDTKQWKWWAIVLRILLIVCTLAMALIIPHFAQLMGLIGSITGVMLSLIWPSYFYLKLKGYQLTWSTIVFNILIILFGLVCTLSGVIDSSKELAKKFQLKVNNTIPHT